jgi:hypothetical protein
MTTYNYYDGSTSGAQAYYGDGSSVAALGKQFVAKRSINLATAGDSLTGSGAFGINDVLQIFEVHDGWYVHEVVLQLNTAESATLACEIGDGDDTDGFLVAGNLNTTAGTYETGYTQTTYAADYCDGTTYHNGRIYAADDTIDIKLTTAGADVAVFDVYILYTILD